MSRRDELEDGGEDLPPDVRARAQRIVDKQSHRTKSRKKLKVMENKNRAKGRP